MCHDKRDRCRVGWEWNGYRYVDRTRNLGWELGKLNAPTNLAPSGLDMRPDLCRTLGSEQEPIDRFGSNERSIEKL